MTAVLHNLESARSAKQSALRNQLATMERIVQQAEAVLQMVRGRTGPCADRQAIDALGYLIACAAEQVSLLCDGRDRREAQYVRRFAEILREQAWKDCLSIEAVAFAIQHTSAPLVERIGVQLASLAPVTKAQDSSATGLSGRA